MSARVWILYRGLKHLSSSTLPRHRWERGAPGLVRRFVAGSSGMQTAEDSKQKEQSVERLEMCSLTKRGRVFVLDFLGTGDHRLGPAMFTDIMSKLEVVNSSEDIGALVTTNEGKFYCNGLDLEWVNVNSEERGPILYKKFEELLLALLNVKVPTVAAICGHAAAGGLAFAMAHDHRFMRADRGFLYSGALDVNVAVPAGTLELMASKLTPRVYRDVVLKCVKFTGKMALENEMIDGLYGDPAETLEEALKEAEALAARNWDKNVYLSMRRAMYSRTILNLEEGESESFTPLAPDLKGFR